MSDRYDLCLVYNDDADQWSRYVVHHLGRDHFRFRLLPVTDRQLVDWLMTSRDGGAPSQCVREVSEAKALIVVISPGLVTLMADHTQFHFNQLVAQPRKAQVGHAPVSVSMYAYACTVMLSSGLGVGLETCVHGLGLGLEASGLGLTQ